jgi:ribosome maturation factor RimP
VDLKQAATDVLTPLGYEVLELHVGSGRGPRRVLLRIDRLDEAAVSVEDVQTASEAFGLELDRLDPFPGAYRLEVESPGAERPLVTARHFERFANLLVKVRVADETLHGRVREVQGDRLVIELEAPLGERREVALADVERARLAEWPDTPR